MEDQLIGGEACKRGREGEGRGGEGRGGERRGEEGRGGAKCCVTIMHFNPLVHT